MKIRGKRISLKWVYLLGIVFIWFLFSIRSIPEAIDYGVSFSKFHSDELKLDWKKVYLAILDDLKVKRVRLSAHWPIIEPIENQYNFSELDFQIKESEKRNTKIILAIGRRLPGWPECHVPPWAKNFSEEKQQGVILKLIETLVERYKNSPSLIYWQVENEPFLGFFAKNHCLSPDKNFLKNEIDLVHKLDPAHPVLVTDSGEFGDWFRTYRHGDIFGSSLYLYIWSPRFGPLRYPIGPSFFRVKQNLVELFGGQKDKILIELSVEPWLLQPIIDTPIDVQFSRMGLDKITRVINFAKKTGFKEQYLWGAEWWYWLSQQGHPEYWNFGRQLFIENK